MNDLESRVAALERSNRRWRAGCVALLLLMGASLVVAAEKSGQPLPIVQAHRIDVVDAKGRAVISLQSGDDAATIAVEGPDHEHTVVLVAKSKSSSLMLLKNKASVGVFAQAGDEGGQVGVTNGRAAADRATLNLVGTPQGFSLFHVVDGRPQSRLSFNATGGGLELRTPGSKAITRVIGSDKGSRIEILDQDGQSVWSAPQQRAQ